MSIEPVQDFVRIKLELDGYFVRSNLRFKVGSATTIGRTAAYSDLDIIAVKIDPKNGLITDRIWGEIKAHLTSTLTASYIRTFSNEYATMLDLTKIDDDHKSMRKWKARKGAAMKTAERMLGPTFRRILYFGGIKPRDRGSSASRLLDPDVEISFISDFARDLVGTLGHREGSEPLVRVINLLKSYGMMEK